jgi:glyoxylase-like metal-dependent hydrolase (beta-lactamase superfamily II)
MPEHREIDVHHLGRERVICCHRIGDVLVDPGPESTHHTLLEALDGAVPRALLLTHIHFDHAGAAGVLARRWPEVEVWVHERGARHLADPERLVASARRLYGEDFDRLWGEVVPVPEENMVVLEGGERRDGFRVAYTPGHASHHVSYLHEETGLAFTGDVSGVRIDGGPVLPPTPPPDVDLDAWRESIAVVRTWAPQAVCPTHFGTFEDVSAHLDGLEEALARAGERARDTDDAGFAAWLREWIAARADPQMAEEYYQAMPPDMQWAGLERYWSKRQAQGTGAQRAER